jgi:hypothetical protein
MTGLRSRPSSLGIAVASSLVLAMVGGISLSELRSEVTPLDGTEAQRILGGQASCSWGAFLYQTSSQACDGGDPNKGGCPKQQNAFYDPGGGSIASILLKYCRNINGGTCGDVQVDLPKCSTGPK